MWLLSFLLLLAAGYSLVWLLGLAQRHLVGDIAMGWFAGTSYFSLVCAVWCLGFRQSLNLPFELLAIALPIAVLLVRRARHIDGMRESINALRTLPHWPAQNRIFYAIIAAAGLATLILLTLHGINTPTAADDAVRVRAYTPMLVYMNILNPVSLPFILNNGIYVSFVPLLGWYLQGTLDHMHVNYMLLATLVSFIVMVFTTGVMRRQPEMGICAAFLALAMPLLVYHYTATYLDATSGIVFAAGFLHLGLYCAEADDVVLRRYFLFVFLTLTIKAEGEILAITSLAAMGLVLGLNFVRSRSIPSKTLIITVGVLAVYAAVKLARGENAFLQMALDTLRGNKSNARIADVGQGSATLPAMARQIFFSSLFESGQFGIIFYVLLANVLFCWRVVRREALLIPLLLLLVLFGEVYVNAVFILPRFTFEQTTVHRSIIVLALSAAMYTGLVWAAAARGAVAPATQTEPARSAAEALN